MNYTARGEEWGGFGCDRTEKLFFHKTPCAMYSSEQTEKINVKNPNNKDNSKPTVKHYGSKQRQPIQGFVRTCVTSRNKIRECILEAFAGPPDCGEYSPSYQKTVNCIQMHVLCKVPQVSSFLLLMFYFNEC